MGKEDPDDPNNNFYEYTIDEDLCDGCGKCVKACKPPAGTARSGSRSATTSASSATPAPSGSPAATGPSSARPVQAFLPGGAAGTARGDPAGARRALRAGRRRAPHRRCPLLSAGRPAAQYQRRRPTSGESTLPRPRPSPAARRPGAVARCRCPGSGPGALGMAVSAGAEPDGVILLSMAALAYFGFYRRGASAPLAPSRTSSSRPRDPAPPWSRARPGVLPPPARRRPPVRAGVLRRGLPHGALQDLVLLRPVRVPNRTRPARSARSSTSTWGRRSFLGRPGDRHRRSRTPPPGRAAVPHLRVGPLHWDLPRDRAVPPCWRWGRASSSWGCSWPAVLPLALPLRRHPQPPLARVLEGLPHHARQGARLRPLLGRACPYGAIESMRALRGPCLSCARCYETCPRHHEARKGRAPARLVRVEELEPSGKAGAP